MERHQLVSGRLRCGTEHQFPRVPFAEPLRRRVLYPCRLERVRLAALGSGIGAVYPAAPSANTLAIDSLGNLYVGGAFTSAGTNAAGNIAKALLTGPTPNQLTLAQPVPPTNVITYLGIPGGTYALDAAVNLTPPINWIPQATNTASTNNATTAGYLTFTNLSGAPQAFYRVRSVP